MKKRLTAFLLCLLLTLIPAVTAGCSDSKVNSEEGGATAETPTADAAQDSAEEEPEPTATRLVKDRYADTDLGGYVYKVFAIPTDGHFYSQVAAGINEVYAEEMNGEIINDAIFNSDATSR